MDPGDLFTALQGRILANAISRTRVCPSARDELISVASLAFWMAWLDRKRCRISLEDWLMLCCINAMNNHLRGERRRWKRLSLYPSQRMDEFPCPHELCLDVSEDAERVAWCLIHHGFEGGRRKSYREVGYEKTWDCIRELQEAFS
jgi:DNA-directed RNA polymerase specialized sigma24 family protein